MNNQESKASIRGLLGNALSLLRCNARCFFVFEVLYAVVGAVVILPLMAGMVQLCMYASGLTYLAPHNMVAFIACPLTWLCLIVFVLLLSFYALVDASACILMCQMSHEGRKASVLAVAKAAAKRAATVAKPKNMPFALVMLLVLPLTNIVLAPSFVGAIEIPDFIVTFITYKMYLVVACVIAALILFVFTVRIRYALHFFTLQGSSYKESSRKSRELGKGHHVRDVVYCILMQLLVALVMAVVLVALGMLVYGLGVAFQSSNVIGQALEVALSACVLVLAAAMAVAAVTGGTLLCYVLISALFYLHGGGALADCSIITQELERRPSKMRSVATWGTAAIMYAVAVMAVSFYYGGVDLSEAKSQVNVDIVAHRCGANYAPENTVAALNKAADMGVTWCEIDVQQCADGSIIVSHDTNLNRTAGLDANTWDVAYDQVKACDSGSKFSAEFAGEPIPLLEDMITAAKARGVKLQIEIKPTGHDEGIEQRVVDIVRKMDFMDSCYIASMKYDCIQKVRACGQDVPILYIMLLGYGDMTAIPDVDAYSLESTWVTEALAANVHTKSNTTLCAWTTNSRSAMERCINNGADQLVTDDILLAKEVIADAQEEESLLLGALGAFRK